MIYTRKSPALLMMGLIMLGIWYLFESGLLSGYIGHLGGAKYKYTGEIATVPLYFGIFSVAVGIWQWQAKPREGHLDYYLSTVAGAMFILLIAMLVRWFLAPEITEAAIKYGAATEDLRNAISVAYNRWKGHPGALCGVAFGEAVANKP